jgi:hypothetical protein
VTYNNKYSYKRKKLNNMVRKVTICIPVCFEFEFLKGSINQIMKCKHPEIEYEIIICDQTSQEMSKMIHDQFSHYSEIKIVKIPRIDAGYPIDVASRMATGQYFCTLDSDAFPISGLWLYLPVRLIEEFGFSFIGKESGLHYSYKDSLGDYFHINNYYRVSKTEVARKISQEIGFIRSQNRNNPLVQLEYSQSFPIECDNGVLAQWWSDKFQMGPKLSLMMDKIIGKTPQLGVWGMIIDDLVFHMVFGQTNEECGIQSLGQDYVNMSKKINQFGLTEEVISELVSMSTTQNILDFYDSENLRINGRQVFDSGNHRFLSEQDQITKFIEEIKNSQKN